jgi:hypothetical protein
MGHFCYAAGTTLGLLSLDKVGLQIVAQAGDTDKEKEYASEVPSSQFNMGVGNLCGLHADVLICRCVCGL